ncbi:MAG: hypothetical protein M5U34_30800 [Chloroflexi bacterium]|nr:hypothetical protein [Chloroflexota bacterium]
MKRKWGRLLHHGAGVVVLFVFLLPIFWIFTASLRQRGLPPPPTIEWWPAEATLDNYPYIFELLPMTRYIRNSLIVVATAVPITVFTASIAGFAMSQEGRCGGGACSLPAWSCSWFREPPSGCSVFKFCAGWVGLIPCGP